jgi:hypothetical protein
MKEKRKKINHVYNAQEQTQTEQQHKIIQNKEKRRERLQCSRANPINHV